MAGKRAATTHLDHENWNKEEKPEDKGVFKVASSDELQTRVIKKARRKLGGDSGSSTDEKKEIFSGFTGFTKTASNATTISASGSPFSFLSKLTPSSKGSEDNHEIKKEEPKGQSSNSFQFEKSNTYYAKLKGLNQAVSSWIKKHVDENPLCILTPIFQDYDKYLKEIENDKEQGSSKPSTTQYTFGSSTSANGSDKLITREEKNTDQKSGSEATTKKSSGASTPLFSFLKSDSGAASSTTTPPFSFGQKTENSTVTSTSSSALSLGKKPDEVVKTETTTTIPASNFSFKSAPRAATSTTGFSFSGAKPFTFSASVSKPEEVSEVPKEGAEEDDEPPKVEFKPVVEEDSVYSKKCKVFIKQGASYTDRGIGTLYLKPVKDSEKTQLIVRADTNLGNITLNFILSESIPSQRMGKNNVMLVCIPTPESDQKPTPILLRVKSAEEADELLETINKYKK